MHSTPPIKQKHTHTPTQRVHMRRQDLCYEVAPQIITCANYVARDKLDVNLLCPQSFVKENLTRNISMQKDWIPKGANCKPLMHTSKKAHHVVLPKRR